MAISNRTDFNVELAELTREASPVTPVRDDAADRQSSENESLRLRIIQELEGTKNIPGMSLEQIRELDGIIGRLQSISGRASVQDLANAIQEARNYGVQMNAIAQQNGQAAMYDSISNVRLSAAGEARVTRQINAIMNDDVQEIIASFRSPSFDTLPAARQAELNEISMRQLESPAGQALRAETRAAIAEEPERFARIRRQTEAYNEELDRLIESETNSARRGALAAFRESNATSMRSAREFMEIARRGGTLEELNAAAAPAYREVQQSLVGMIATIRETNFQHVNDIIDNAPTDMQERLRTNDQELSNYIIRHMRDVTPEARTNALVELQRYNGDYERLSRESRQVLAIDGIMMTTSSAISMQGVLAQMGRTAELARAQAQDGRVLTVEEQSHVDRLNFIGDTSNALVDRARQLAEVTSIAGVLDGANARMRQRIAETPENSLTLATLTLAFTDRNGGIEQFQRMARSMQMSTAQGPDNPEAVAYFANYNNFISQTLIGENFDKDNPSQGTRLAAAMRIAGLELQNGTMQVLDSPEGIRLYRPNSLDFGGKASAFTNTEDLLLQASGGVGGMVDRMYAESRTGERSNDAEFVRAVRQIDAYRLHSDPSSQQMILDLQFGRRTAEEVRGELDGRMAAVRQGMEPFADGILGHSNDSTRAALERAGILNADGGVDISQLMKQVENNRVQFADVYRQYLETPLDQLPPGLADARLLRQFTTQLQSAYSISNLAQRRDVVANELTAHEANGTTPPATLVAEGNRLAIITGYRPDTATSEQHAQFDGAIREYLMQDPYIRDKEIADRNLPEAARSNLVASTVSQIRAAVTKDPLYFSERSSGQYEELTYFNDIDLLPLEPLQPLIIATPRIVSRYDAQATLEQRESEGSSGLLDSASKTDLEKAIIGVLQSMTTDVRYTGMSVEEARTTHFGTAVGAHNVGDQNFISYNEIERALIANGWRRPADIDIDRNGVDDQDILRALATPNPANNQGQGR